MSPESGPSISPARGVIREGPDGPQISSPAGQADPTQTSLGAQGVRSLALVQGGVSNWISAPGLGREENANFPPLVFLLPTELFP